MDLIDWSRVAELREEVGEEDFAEVVELFLEEVDEVIDRLRTAPNSADLESEMHFLKGSALNLGFRSLGEICQSGEKAADPARFDLAPVFSTYESSKVAFLKQT